MDQTALTEQNEQTAPAAGSQSAVVPPSAPGTSKSFARWAWLLAWVWPLAGAALLLVPALRATGGQFSAPIDDAFIHAQYAKYFAQGRLFTWSPDAAYSLGETSPLYPLVLAVGYLAGFRDHWIMAFALLVNLAGTALLLRVAMGQIRRNAGAGLAQLFPGLLLLNGSLLWSLASGMELGFCLGLLGFFLWATARAWSFPAQKRPNGILLLAAALLPLGRPDWLLLTGPFFLALAWRHWPRWRWRGLLYPSVAAVPLALLFALNWSQTGLALPNSLALKSLWRSPVLAWAEKAALFRAHLTDVPWKFADASWGAWFVVLACLLLAVPVLAGLVRGWRRRGEGEFGLDLALLGAVLLHALLNASMQHSPRDCYRYYLGDWVLAALALVRLAGAGLRDWPRLSAGPRRLARAAVYAGLGLFLLGGALHLGGFQRQFVADWRYIFENHIRLGRLIREHQARDPRLGQPILTHEAGAVPYFSGGRFYDLVGLCSNPGGLRLTDYYLTDASLFFEALEREDPARWPELAAVFDLFNRPPFAVQALEPAVGNSVLDRPPLGLYRFPRELLRSGDEPRPRALPPGWVVRDRIDVADLASEQAHSFRLEWPRERVIREALFKEGEAGGRPIGDCGRRLNVPAHWQFKNLEPGRPLRIWARVALPRESSFTLRLGESAPSAQKLARAPEFQIVTLGELASVPKQTFTVRLELLSGSLQVFHIWAVQPAAPVAR